MESFRNLAPAKKVQRVPFECTLGPARQGSTTTLRLCDLVSRRRVWAEGSCNAPGALSSKCRPCPKSVKARREEGVRAVSRTSGGGAAVLGDFIEQRDCFLRRTKEYSWSCLSRQSRHFFDLLAGFRMPSWSSFSCPLHPSPSSILSIYLSSRVFKMSLERPNPRK